MRPTRWISASMIVGAGALVLAGCSSTSSSPAASASSADDVIDSTAGGKIKKIKDVRPYRPLIDFSSGTVAYTCNNPSRLLTNQAGMALQAIRKV